MGGGGMDYRRGGGWVKEGEKVRKRNGEVAGEVWRFGVVRLPRPRP